MSCRGKDAYIDTARSRAAKRLKRTSPDHAQELALCAQAQRSDLVEEDGAAVGEHEPARPRCLRLRERTRLVPEQLALQVRLIERGAPDLDEWMGVPGRLMMENDR